MTAAWATALNACWAGLILLAAFAMVATRQVRAVLWTFVMQSGILALAAATLAWRFGSWDLWTLAAITVLEKIVAIPWVLRRLLPGEYYSRREVLQAVGITPSLLAALALAIAAEYLATPLTVGGDALTRANLPIGLGCVLIGAYTLLARREAMPQLIGILAMENGVFLAGIAIAPTLPIIAELAVALDMILIAAVVGVLTRHLYSEAGTTAGAALHALREEAAPWR